MKTTYVLVLPLCRYFRVNDIKLINIYIIHGLSSFGAIFSITTLRDSVIKHSSVLSFNGYKLTFFGARGTFPHFLGSFRRMRMKVIDISCFLPHKHTLRHAFIIYFDGECSRLVVCIREKVFFVLAQIEDEKKGKAWKSNWKMLWRNSGSMLLCLGERTRRKSGKARIPTWSHVEYPIFLFVVFPLWIC